MIAKTISFIVICLLITGVVVWTFAAFDEKTVIKDKIERIEVYKAEAAEPSETITDKGYIEGLLKCINECEREEMSQEASYAAADVNLILYGEKADYEVGVWQQAGTVSFVYDAAIIDSDLEPFPVK
ncbi:hypothetical protein [Terribacillus sp. 7520-G]|uniref:hypothetical protein n=1 Tax=unclassified Terribacillus TaxID=2636508 RepID=UPI000BA6D7CD|nr:hypothetical protein [Terribacillus sp. 7520-G]PAD37764.1 hypothetical protein CHH53_14720 [Terribacillus sp. 7520-G]